MASSEIDIRQRFPHIGKLSVAILENLVEKVIGESAIEEVKKPYLQKQIADSLAEALAQVEAEFNRQHSDRDACNVLMQLPVHNLPSAQSAIWAFYERPNDRQFPELLVQQLRAISPLSELQINDAVTAYMGFLKRELLNIDPELRDKIQALAILDIAEAMRESNAARLPEIIQAEQPEPGG